MSIERIDHLERLARLRDSGALSSEEYEVEKQKVLSSEAVGVSHPSSRKLSRARSTWMVIGGVIGFSVVAAVVVFTSTTINDSEATSVIPAQAATSVTLNGSKAKSALSVQESPGAPVSVNNIVAEPKNTFLSPPREPTVSRAGPPDLARYAGKYADDPVDGIKFLSHPQVRKLVRAAAPAAIAKRILDGNAVAGPVQVDSEYVLYSGCEPHNCGSHQWSVLIDRQTQIPVVCYYTEEEGTAYLHHEGRIDIADNCPSDLES